MDEDFDQLKALTEVVKDAIAHKENGSSKKLMYFIKRSLGQVGLTHEWEESEILIQAYFRAREKVLAGERISNYGAYLTRIAYFVILEESKRRNRRGKLNKKLSHDGTKTETTPAEGYVEGISDELMRSLWASFEALSPRDRRILMLRIVRGLSWRDISALMVKDGEEKNDGKSLDAKLRKQGERALAKLRRQIMAVDHQQLK